MGGRRGGGGAYHPAYRAWRVWSPAPAPWPWANGSRSQARASFTEADRDRGRRARRIPKRKWKSSSSSTRPKGLSEEEARALAGRLLSQKGRGAGYAGARRARHRSEEARRLALVGRRYILRLVRARRHFPGGAVFFLSGRAAVLASIAVCGIGARRGGRGDIAFHRARDVGFSAMRQLGIGYAAALVTYRLRPPCRRGPWLIWSPMTRLSYVDACAALARTERAV